MAKKVVRMFTMNPGAGEVDVALPMIEKLALGQANIRPPYDLHLHQKIAHRSQVEPAVEELCRDGTDAFLFLMHLWNHELVAEVAERVQARNRKAIVVQAGFETGACAIGGWNLPAVYFASELEQLDFGDLELAHHLGRDLYERNIRRLQARNPTTPIELTLVLGLPRANYDSFLGALELALSLGPKDLAVRDLHIPRGSELAAHPEQFGVIIDREPPHQLVYNYSFPWEEYFQAKHVAYHAKLFQKELRLRDRLLELVDELGGTHVDVYAGLAEFAIDRGLSMLGGKDIRDVSCSEFDARTDRFLADPPSVRALHRIFQEYRDHVRGSRVAGGADLPKKKSFERWVRGGL